MTTDPAPLPPDRVDELLSAELDGELASAASDLGLTLEGVRSARAGRRGADDRRAALAAARDALATEPLPARAGDALVARAIASAHQDELAARRSRPSRPLALAGAAAAAVPLVLGLVAIGGGRGDDDASTADAGSAATAASVAEEQSAAEGRDGGETGSAPAAQAAPDPSVVSFGAVDELDRLASEVRARLDPPPAPRTDARAGDDDAFRTFDEVAPVDPACEESLADGGTVVLRGTVDFAGRPASVIVLEHPGGRTLVVVETGCSVLARAPLDPGP